MRVPARKRTAGTPIALLEPAPLVRVPVRGLRAVVAPGERVSAGQLVAVSPPGAKWELRRHSPYEGTVVAAGDDEVAVAGRPVPALPVPAPEAPHRDPATLAPHAIVEAARAAGVVGMGGAMFPTHVKLTARMVECVIVNACESEPYLCGDARVLAERRADVECGMRLAMRAVGAPRGVIATSTRGYPDGHEALLVERILGRAMLPGGLPSDAGAIVVNVQTAVALHEAVCAGRPLLDRVVTVDGAAVGRPGNYRVAIGTAIGHVLAACGTDPPRIAAIVAGGPMMGVEVDAETPVAPGTTGVLALAAGEVSRPSATPCIRCGECLAACPLGLSARHLLRRPDAALRECIECGMCQYVCPARRPLVALLRGAKAMLA